MSTETLSYVFCESNCKNPKIIHCKEISSCQRMENLILPPLNNNNKVKIHIKCLQPLFLNLCGSRRGISKEWQILRKFWILYCCFSSCAVRWEFINNNLVPVEGERKMIEMINKKKEEIAPITITANKKKKKKKWMSFFILLYLPKNWKPMPTPPFVL